ncbi:hypothetical protein SBA2_120032 [Acidobacteriia bacterium SbA2]|nr:hypothetical protein SBA2_120032 [Acidobacteriia bacterium SbA2]
MTLHRAGPADYDWTLPAKPHASDVHDACASLSVLGVGCPAYKRANLRDVVNTDLSSNSHCHPSLWSAAA